MSDRFNQKFRRRVDERGVSTRILKIERIKKRSDCKKFDQKQENSIFIQIMPLKLGWGLECAVQVPLRNPEPFPETLTPCIGNFGTEWLDIWHQI